MTWTDDFRNTSVGLFRIYRLTTAGRVFVADVPKSAAGTAYRYLHRGTSGAETYTYEVVGVGNLNREGPAATATAR